MRGCSSLMRLKNTNHDRSCCARSSENRSAEKRHRINSDNEQNPVSSSCTRSSENSSVEKRHRPSTSVDTEAASPPRAVWRCRAEVAHAFPREGAEGRQRGDTDGKMAVDGMRRL
mmetsp:Transcript_23033/g.46003  ORF Transcript_23033/g.46003 Transcript_23033/m.46003 type:complete len:115 (+) Transcript_23033:827-1171(+)